MPTASFHVPECYRYWTYKLQWNKKKCKIFNGYVYLLIELTVVVRTGVTLLSLDGYNVVSEEAELDDEAVTKELAASDDEGDMWLLHCICGGGTVGITAAWLLWSTYATKQINNIMYVYFT